MTTTTTLHVSAPVPHVEWGTAWTDEDPVEAEVRRVLRRETGRRFDFWLTQGTTLATDHRGRVTYTEHTLCRMHPRGSVAARVMISWPIREED